MLFILNGVCFLRRPASSRVSSSLIMVRTELTCIKMVCIMSSAHMSPTMAETVTIKILQVNRASKGNYRERPIEEAYRKRPIERPIGQDRHTLAGAGYISLSAD